MCEPNGLLHLGGLAFPADSHPGPSYDPDVLPCTGLSLLAEEDRILLKQLSPNQVQEWCLSRITEYQNRNRVLRESYSAAARDAISTNKSHVRALRSAYNDAAPINQCLPPEMLMEVFSHVHPAVVPRVLVPVLRVCRYWRRLLFKTPRFWANLLNLPTWDAWNPNYRICRFRAAITRSAPASLDLFVPYSSGSMVDILVPHASRLSSFTVGPTRYNVEEMTRVLEQHMPSLTHLVILHTWWYTTSTFQFDFPRYPNIQNLELERTHFYTPVAPYTSLCHLKLRNSTIQPSPTSDSVPSLCAVHNALQFFPNLETLSMTCSLSHDDPHGCSRSVLPELMNSVHLPRLRHLEVEDIPAYIPPFLSHLVFPATTSLILEPAYRLNGSRRPPAVPIFPGINPFSSPNAELSLYLDFSGHRNQDTLARWETHGDAVRPVRVTLAGCASHIPTVARFTRELEGALAPAPARGVTSLTVDGSYVYRGLDWELLLSNMPGLRCFTCQTWQWATGGFVRALGQSRSLEGSSDEFLCPRLEELVLRWSLPHCIRDLGHLQEAMSLCRSLRPDSGAGGQHGEAEPSRSESKSPLAACLSEFCDTFVPSLTRRAGRCEPIRKLSLSLHWYHRYGCNTLELEGWQVALIEQRLRNALGHLVGDVAVSSEVH